MGDLYVHSGKVESGSVKIGDSVNLEIDTEKRNNSNYETFNNVGISKERNINTKKRDLLKNRRLIQCSASNMKKCKYSKAFDRDLYDDLKWCERILYSSSTSSKIKCTEYNSYDFGQFMANSKHKAVYSHIEITL